MDDTINAQSTIRLFQQTEAQNPQAERIQIICDNARYYHAQCVKDYLTQSKIELVFLPPYASNLNLIERFWKFFKKTVLYGRYYETFGQFKAACDHFFAGLDQYHAPCVRY
jgi:transposase